MLPLLLLAIAVVVVIGFAFLTVTGRLPPVSEAGPYPFFWPIFPFGFFLTVFLVFFAFRWSAWGSWDGYLPYRTAHEILRERYARGELTREQMQAMTAELDGSK